MSPAYFPLQVNAHHLLAATDECNCHILVISHLYSDALRRVMREREAVCVCLFSGYHNGGSHTLVNESFCPCKYLRSCVRVCVCACVLSAVCNEVGINFCSTIKLMLRCSSLTCVPFSFNFLASAFSGLFLFSLHV